MKRLSDLVQFICATGKSRYKTYLTYNITYYTCGFTVNRGIVNKNSNTLMSYAQNPFICKINMLTRNRAQSYGVRIQVASFLLYVECTQSYIIR